ncbi:MAG: tail fiber domain-containing protein [Nannocystaceae bacterium]|nr:tail fiber domain-containing protein [Myxococcales bacterium]
MALHDLPLVSLRSLGALSLALALVACGDSDGTTGNSSETASTSESSESSESSQSSESTAGSTSESSTNGTSESEVGSDSGSSESSTDGPTTDPTTETTDPTTDPTDPSETTDPTDPSETTDPTETTETDTTDTGESETGNICVGEGDSCALQEKCCEGLVCCSGLPIPPGSEFCGLDCPISDKNFKRDFTPVDPDAVLRAIAELEISTWSYKEDDKEARHIGPMAQDFREKLGVGGTERYIYQVDADGASLAAIQALHRRVRELEGENTSLRSNVRALEARLSKLEAGR